jgi:hypothetical protein
MTDKVWMCEVKRRTEAFRSFRSALKNEPRPAGFSNTEINEANDSNLKGEPLPRSRFPEALFHLRPQKYAKSVPPVLNPNCLCLRGDAAEIFRRHDMGHGALYPVKLYEYDKTTLIRDDIFVLNIGNEKDTLIVEQSPGLVRPNSQGTKFYTDDDPTAKYVARREVLDGPDIWADPKVWDVFFLSDRLVQALTAAKMKRYFFLVACDVAA